MLEIKRRSSIMKSYRVYYKIDENGKNNEGRMWVQADSASRAEGFAVHQLEEQHPDGVLLTCEVVTIRED
jgi:hypothetical protein